jgi:Holliday junction resolvase
MINSNRKGRDGEEELVRIIREQGFPRIRRSQQYCGKSGESADLVGLPNIHIECKRVEKLNIFEAIKQAIRDVLHSGASKLACVFHRKNRERWLVTMTLEDWFVLYSHSDLSDMDELDELDEVEE